MAGHKAFFSHLHLPKPTVDAGRWKINCATVNALHLSGHLVKRGQICVYMGGKYRLILLVTWKLSSGSKSK